MISFINPFSSEHHAVATLQAADVSPAAKAAIWALSILAGLLTFGVGGVALFRYLVGRVKPISESPQQVQTTAAKAGAAAQKSLGMQVKECLALYGDIGNEDENGKYTVTFSKTPSLVEKLGNKMQFSQVVTMQVIKEENKETTKLIAGLALNDVPINIEVSHSQKLAFSWKGGSGFLASGALFLASGMIGKMSVKDFMDAMHEKARDHLPPRQP